MSAVTAHRLTDPGLDFWVDLRIFRSHRGWLAVAELAGTPDIGVARDQGLAVLLALWSLGPDVAQRLASEIAPIWTGPAER